MLLTLNIKQTANEDELNITIENGRNNIVEVEEIVEDPNEKEATVYYSKSDAIDLAKVMYKECGGLPSDTEKACVAWCVLNRVDKDKSTIYEVVRKPNQYAFYESTKVTDELLDLATDVLERWNAEKNGETNVGRVLPKEYLYFTGDGKHNYFRDSFSSPYNVWDYSLESPYDS